MTQISTPATTYANSLIQTDTNYDVVLNDLKTAVKIIDGSQDLINTLENPAISIQIKLEIIDEVFKSQVSEKIVNFLKIITEKGRFNEFKQIVQAYELKVDEIRNIKRVEVVSVVELSNSQKEQLTKNLQNRLNCNVNITWILSEDIIGGLLIKYDDDIMDYSLKNKLEKLSKI